MEGDGWSLLFPEDPPNPPYLHVLLVWDWGPLGGRAGAGWNLGSLGEMEVETIRG